MSNQIPEWAGIALRLRSNSHSSGYVLVVAQMIPTEGEIRFDEDERDVTYFDRHDRIYLPPQVLSVSLRGRTIDQDHWSRWNPDAHRRPAGQIAGRHALTGEVLPSLPGREDR